jgi:hypothetical protein
MVRIGFGDSRHATKTISGYCHYGYRLSPDTSELIITRRGGFYFGVYSYHYATISNAGTIGVGDSGNFPSRGVYLPQGGEIINGPTGLIAGRFAAEGEAGARVRSIRRPRAMAADSSFMGALTGSLGDSSAIHRLSALPER